MKTRRIKSKNDPGYPSRRQFMEYRALAGVAAIGLSAMTASCRETILGEIRSMKPEQASNFQTEDSDQDINKFVPISTGGVPIPINLETIPEIGTTYTIKEGDTLSAISKKMLGSAGRWREIIKLNPGLNPDKLQIGQIIKIPKTGENKVMNSAGGAIEKNNSDKLPEAAKNTK